MNRSSIYTALLVSFAGISGAQAATFTQDITTNYEDSPIPDPVHCVTFSLMDWGDHCTANIETKGLTLAPDHPFVVTVPTFEAYEGWQEAESPRRVRALGKVGSTECEDMGDNQWSCTVPASGFPESGAPLELWVDPLEPRNSWIGELTIDDLQQDVPLQDCIVRSIQLVEQWKNQALDSYRYTAEKLHLALDGIPTKPYQDVIDENALILDILHTCALQPDTVPALLKPMPEKPKHD
ncbi:hypothetical protein BS333_08680 [Vibrio azureus]|uniref:Uncharacterized protein n=1 Tax=Vibrio azureus NBRC 104587 TaxID=1219077 RepID=U3BXM1_9VIBR|nr:hypothetical protein [Vibrio azureus]AUI86455.1 hypothetical protein BS333_08680 [Vibrio azureus]GAD74064.1 hypothetical protein VAZ01S_001_00020 [Vibrio azureus NBRC 104587]